MRSMYVAIDRWTARDASVTLLALVVVQAGTTIAFTDTVRPVTAVVLRIN